MFLSGLLKFSQILRNLFFQIFEIRKYFGLPYFFANFKTIHAGKHHIQNDQLGRFLLEHFETLFRMGGRQDAETKIAQKAFQQLIEFFIVIDY